MMNIKKTVAFIKNRKGAALILTMMFISIILSMFIAMASFSLSETVGHVQRANAKVMQINVAQDISQALARAYTLGRSPEPCPGGTTQIEPVVGVQLCVPNTGVAVGAGLNSICVDLDQNAASRHDQYCINSLRVVTQWTPPEEEKPSMVASVMSVFARKFNSFFLDVESANAQCTSWFNCAPPVEGSAGSGNTQGVGIDPPVAYSIEPTGASTEATGGTQLASNNLDTWFPTPTWSNDNDIYTPACNTGVTQYWLGCVNCAQPEVKCMEFTICPASKPSCTTAERMTQGVAFY